jgi:hypothetical protein
MNAQQRRQKIKQAVKQAKAEEKKDAWKKAGAVPYDEEEKQRIIRDKEMQFIKRQETFKEAFLIRHAKQIRLGDFAKVIQSKLNKIEEVKKLVIPEEQKQLQIEELNGPFKMFGGHFSSLRHALAEFKLEEYHYSVAIKSENYFIQALKNDGLTEEQINGILEEGKYIKSDEVPKQNTDLDDKHPDYMG